MVIKAKIFLALIIELLTDNLSLCGDGF